NLGQQLGFQVLPSDPGVRFTLLDTTGHALFSNTSTGQVINSVPATGTYTVVVSGNGDQTGKYGFRINDLAAANSTTVDPPFTLRQVVNGNLTRPFSYDFWTSRVPTSQWVYFSALTPKTTIDWTVFGPPSYETTAPHFFRNYAPLSDQGPLFLPAGTGYEMF